MYRVHVSNSEFGGADDARPGLGAPVKCVVEVNLFVVNARVFLLKNARHGDHVGTNGYLSLR